VDNDTKEKGADRVIEELSVALKQEQEAHSNESKELNAALRVQQEAHKYNEEQLKTALKQEREAHSNDVTSLDSLVESMKNDKNEHEQRIKDLEVVLRSVYPEAQVLQIPLGGPSRIFEGSSSASATGTGPLSATGMDSVSAPGTPFASGRSLSSFSPVLGRRSSADDLDVPPSPGSTVFSTSELGDRLGNRSKENTWILRMFRRLLFEKFSHLEPEDLNRALKMETRPSTMLRVEVEKVLKSYKAHQKGFGMRKAFQRLDAQRTGQVDQATFESRMRQIFSMDATLSSHIFRLLLEQAGIEAGFIGEEQFAQSLGEKLVRSSSQGG